ncbi:hypothetical protein M2281_004095 [Mesorhizobium soli]|uniref:hypothetical protein n=1 Tax=Pseudaminobacter soli (ex Li et al. 2025) TaxID=1295366 RepID=UPI00247416E2|nr:hypothetical protein [Mesorhizobium soli]MDH6233484.1 hypothetical protein [Mesorhizobium soli]
MTIARNLISVAAIAAAAAALAGCVGAGPDVINGGPVGVAPRGGVEGEWLSTDGVAVSRFSGGAFETNALDTGNKLADGSYRMVDARNVEITMRSLIRQTTSNVNCALATANQLNCTSSSGQQFVMTRRPITG